MRLVEDYIGILSEGVIAHPPRLYDAVMGWLKDVAAAVMVARAKESGDPEEIEYADGIAKGHKSVKWTKAGASVKIKLDLRGWPYGDEVSDRIPKTFTVKATPGGSRYDARVGARWVITYRTKARKDISRLTLEISIPNKAVSPRRVDEYFSSSVRHELQHLAQTLIGVKAGLGDMPSLISGRLKSRRTSPMKLAGGISREVTKGEVERQILLDVEFQTKLTDAIADMRDLLDVVPAENHKSQIQVWIGARKSVRSDWQREPMKFFEVLKRRAPAKWRRAVKEVVSQLGGSL